MLRHALLSAAVLSLFSVNAHAARDMRLFSLKTAAEYSGFQQTGRYEEVEALCQRFENHHPKQVRCLDRRQPWCRHISTDLPSTQRLLCPLPAK